MLKKTITYIDFNDVEQTEDFYFNLSKSEIAELNLRTEGGLIKHLESIAASNSGDVIVTKFKDLIKWSYGVKSEDGKRFIKTDELWEEFTQTNAYDVLFMELATDAQAGADFMNGVVPQDMANPKVAPQDHRPKEIPTATVPSQVSIDQEELERLRAFEASAKQEGQNRPALD